MPPMMISGIGRHVLEQLAKASLGTEVLYSFVIIAVSLIIYFGTKEMYNLTSHKGIKYFRLAFLFFAITFFFRSFIKFLLLSFDIERAIEIQGIGILSFLVFMYASSMAIFYLLYSVMWKKWGENKITIFHILAIAIAVVAFIIRSPGIILLIHLILFAFLAIVIFLSYHESKKRRKGHHLHVIYMLLFAFWILNIMDLATNALGTFKLLVYLASTRIFLTILYRVISKLGA